jgi:prophage tail gpP-like protein
MQVKGYPRCGFLECPLPITKFPAEFNNQDLQKIAESLAEPFGVPVEFKDAAGNKFKKTAIKPEEKVIDFIIKLAGERGLLVSNNAQGGLLFWKASSGKATASIKEGEFPYLSCQPTFNPQEYYSHITGLSKTTNTKKAAKYTVENSFLIKHGVTRPFNYLVEDDEEGDLKDSVKSKAARMFANACSYELVVQGHKSKDNKRWAKNTLISVMAPGAMIYKDTTFLIKKCRTLKNSNSGSTTELSLVLPSSYSGEMPEVIPWED